MIGTQQEMLIFVTYSYREWYKRFEDLSYYESLKIRSQCIYNSLPDDIAAQILTEFGCVKIRDKINVPSVWTDGTEYFEGRKKFGEIITQRTWYRKVGWNCYNARDRKKNFLNGTIHLSSINKVLTAYGYTCLREELVLPAIWEMVPIFTKPISRNQYVMGRLMYNPEEV